MSFRIFLAALAIGTLTACVPLDRQGRPLEEKNLTPDSADEAEIALGNKLLGTIRKNDYKAFSALLAGRSAVDFTKKDFETSYENIQKQFGAISDTRYLLRLDTPLVKNLVWVVTFQRRDKDDRQTISQQMLFRLVTGNDENGILVMGLGFF